MPALPSQILEYKNQYKGLGLKPIPLCPNSKEPIPGHSWERKDIWNYAEESSNIGLICGGNAKLAVIDCDNKSNPDTFTRINGYLESLGITNYPLMKTASLISRHIYLQLLNPPEGSYNLIKPDIGCGEIRYGSGCYVVAPPSVIDNECQYELLRGNIAERPLVSWNDLEPIISTTSFSKINGQVLIFEKLSRNTKNLLYGKNIERYQSRSEVEQAIILSCINSYLGFEEILNLFMQYPAAGKFKEKYSRNPQSGIAYLQRSYQSAKEYAEKNNSEGRQEAINADNWVHSRSWEGRTGSHDRSVMLAHIQIQYSCGKTEYQASIRELAQKSGKCISSVSNANKRLEEQGFIVKVKESTCSLATIYRLGQTCTLPQYNTVRECSTLSSHDAFRWRGLGKSGLQVWEAILESPKTIEELEEATGKCRKTIERKLEKMGNLIDMRTREIISMVAFNGDKYSPVNNFDLDYIAELLGTKGMGERQKARHEKERKEHKAILCKNLDEI
jgi:predicted transcriptional regulator